MWAFNDITSKYGVILTYSHIRDIHTYINKVRCTILYVVFAFIYLSGRLMVSALSYQLSTFLSCEWESVSLVALYHFVRIICSFVVPFLFSVFILFCIWWWSLYVISHSHCYSHPSIRVGDGVVWVGLQPYKENNNECNNTS